MKKILCNDRISTITLEPKEVTTILFFEPYVGNTFIDLKILSNPDHCIAYSGRSDGFPKITIFNHWNEMPMDTYLVLSQTENIYTAYLSISHQDQLVYMRGAKDGIHLEGVSGMSRRANELRAALIFLQESDPHTLIQKIFSQALQITGNLGKPLKDKSLPKWSCKIGWAAAPSLGHDTLVAEAEALVNQGVPLAFAILKDGWQSTNNNKSEVTPSPLSSFEADSTLFPYGLKGVTDDLKKLNIHYVGVSHPMMGSKKGIESQLAKKYDLTPDQSGRYFLGYDLGRVFQFYHDYYSKLRENGISFVQVIDQGSPFRFYRKGVDITNIYQNCQTGIQAAAGVHFHTSAFSSECMQNPNLFYWGSAAVAQVACNGKIKQSLQNGFWMRYLMEPYGGHWTECNEQHAMFHALSSSNLIIENLGSEVLPFVEKMTQPSGELLTPDFPLTLCNDSLFVEPEATPTCYKAFTLRGEWGIIAAFNLLNENKAVNGRIGPIDIPGFIDDRYAVLSYKKGFQGVLLHDERLAIEVASGEADIFTLAPVKEGVAVLGFKGFYLSPGPVIEINIEEEGIHISSVFGGTILIYCEHVVFEVKRNGETVPWEYDELLCLLIIDTSKQLMKTHANYTVTFVD